MKEISLQIFIEKLKNINLIAHNVDANIIKSFNELFSSGAFTVEKAKTFIKSQEKILIDNNLVIHRNLQEKNELITKSFELAFNKNREQITFFQKDAEQKIQQLHNEFQQTRNTINNQILDFEKEYQEKLTLIQKNYDEEVLEINKEINDKKQEHNVNSLRLEKEFSEKLSLLTKNYEDEIALINSQISLIKTTVKDNIERLKTILEQETKSKDNTYLTIKKTHNTSSQTLNNFINEIKTNYQEKIDELTTIFNNQINDLKIEIEDIREYHENAKNIIVEEHNNKLNALNIVFDVQKAEHQNENDNIIQRHNENITKINNELSTHKDAINAQIERLEIEKHQKVKELNDIIEIERIKRSYNSEINKLNKALLKIISETEQKISIANIVFQTNLFNHDRQNIRHLNEWRFIKAIYDKQRELDYSTAVVKIENELFKLTEKEKFLTLQFKLQKEIINLQLEIELIPVESQLYLASLLQNRDINLLNIEFDSFKLVNELNIEILEKEAELEIAKLKNNIAVLHENYLFDRHYLTLNHQLNIEKNIINRNNELEILNLNITLQQYLLDLNINKVTDEFNNFKKHQLLLIDLEKLSYDYNKNYYKKLAFIEHNKRIKIIEEIKSKNQRTINTIISDRNIKLSKNEAELHEKINIYYMDYILGLFGNQQKSYNLLSKLLTEAISPEIIRQLLLLLKDYNDYILQDFSNAINDYLNYNKYHFNLIVTSNTNTSYQSKHEIIINEFNDDINKITESRKLLSDRINILLKENKQYELEISQNNIEIDLLTKDNANRHLVSDLKSKNKSLLLLISNNEKLVKNLFKQRKPLDNNIISRTKTKEKDEQKLIKANKKENLKFHYTIKKYENDFKEIINNVSNFIYELNNHYTQMINNPYLNDQSINLVNKKVSKLFTRNNKYIIYKFTNVIEFWLKNYLDKKRDNEKVITNFNNATNTALNRINTNYEKFLVYEEKEQKELLKIYNNKIAAINNEITNILILQDKTKKLNNDLYNIKYEEIIKQINNLKTTTTNKHLLINENLHYAKNEYRRQLNKKLKDLKNQIKKEQTTILTKIILNNKELELNTKRTNARADVLLNRYESNRNRYLKSMNSRKNKLDLSIDKNELTINNEQKSLAKAIDLNNSQTKTNLSNLTIELKNYRKDNLKIKKKTIRKEVKNLKANYRFKKRELNID